MSRNSEIMSLELSRLDMCDLMSATLSVYFDMDEEMHDKKTREDRKEVLAESMKKWERLHEEIKRQINAFDREYNERHSKEV